MLQNHISQMSENHILLMSEIYVLYLTSFELNCIGKSKYDFGICRIFYVDLMQVVKIISHRTKLNFSGILVGGGWCHQATSHCLK